MANTTPAAWQIVGLSEQFTQLQPTAVMCNAKSYVLFRDSSNNLCALIDQCAHRRAPLSLGKITEQGWIECPYHGWRFDGSSGQCQAIPNLSADEAVPQYKVAHFNVVENQGFVALSNTGKAANTVLTLPRLAETATQWQGQSLLTYPQQALLDLLLDSPSTVLAIRGVLIMDSIRYGEPVADDTGVTSHMAALWSNNGRQPKQLPADYPLSVKLWVAHSGTWAQVELLDELETVLASALISFSTVKPTLSQTFWRGGANTNKTVSIEVRTQLDASAIKACHNYVSSFRHTGPTATN